MVVTFILGALAGWFAKRAEPRVREGLHRVDPAAAPGEVEVSLLALAVAILIAAVLAALVASHPSPIALSLGAVIGVLGPRIRRNWEQRRVPDYDS